MIRINDTVGHFNDWIKPVEELADEALVHFSETGLEIRVIDPANVAIVHVNAPKEAFDGYACDENLTTGIELYELTCMLEDEDEEEVAVMDIITENEYFEGNPEWKICKLFMRNDGVLVNSINPLNPGSFEKTPKINNIVNTAEFTIDSTLLKHIIKKASKISDYITVGVTTNTDNDIEITFSTEGSYTRKFEAKFTSADILRCDKDAVSLYSLDYLKDIVKSIRYGKSINIQLSSVSPLFLKYDILNGGQVTFSLAPRVKSE